MLTSKVPSRHLDLPHEIGEWIEIRTLSGNQIQLARDASRRAGLQRLQEMGADLVQATTAAATPEAVAAARAETAADPLQGLDRSTLLIFGIVDWSYDAPVSVENIEDLDEETMQFVALALAPRPRTLDELKNGSGALTPTSTGGANRRKSG